MIKIKSPHPKAKRRASENTCQKRKSFLSESEHKIRKKEELDQMGDESEPELVYSHGPASIGSGRGRQSVVTRLDFSESSEDDASAVTHQTSVNSNAQSATSPASRSSHSIAPLEHGTPIALGIDSPINRHPVPHSTAKINRTVPRRPQGFDHGPPRDYLSKTSENLAALPTSRQSSHTSRPSIFSDPTPFSATSPHQASHKSASSTTSAPVFPTFNLPHKQSSLLANNLQNNNNLLPHNNLLSTNNNNNLISNTNTNMIPKNQIHNRNNNNNSNNQNNNNNNHNNNNNCNNTPIFNQSISSSTHNISVHNRSLPAHLTESGVFGGTNNANNLNHNNNNNNNNTSNNSLGNISIISEPIFRQRELPTGFLPAPPLVDTPRDVLSLSQSSDEEREGFLSRSPAVPKRRQCPATPSPHKHKSPGRFLGGGSLGGHLDTSLLSTRTAHNYSYDTPESSPERQPRFDKRREASPPRVRLPHNTNPFSPCPSKVGDHARHLRFDIAHGSSFFRNHFDNPQPIGKGDFGNVFQARHHLDGREYAIKIRAKKATEPKKTFYQEVFALSSVPTDRHLLRYYSSWLSDDGRAVYIQTELCSTDLKRQLDRRKKDKQHYSELELCEVLSQIAQGLSSLHRVNLAHMDIKPSNIYIDFDSCPHHGNSSASNLGIYKIGDFGNTTSATDEDREEGDRSYLAPEVLNSVMDEETPLDLRQADIFSLGVTLYELASLHIIPSSPCDEYHRIRRADVNLTELGYSQALELLVNDLLRPIDPRNTSTWRPDARTIIQRSTALARQLQPNHTTLDDSISNL